MPRRGRINNNNFNRIYTKKSEKTNCNKIDSHISSNKYNYSENAQIEHKNNGNRKFNRIRTTSKSAKDMEKEIVYNISSSLISLYKPKMKFNKENNFKIKEEDKNKYKLQSSRISYNLSKFSKNKRDNSKRNSKDENFQSSLSNDTQILKKNSKAKKFHTFIKQNLSKKSKKTKKKKYF